MDEIIHISSQQSLSQKRANSRPKGCGSSRLLAKIRLFVQKEAITVTDDRNILAMFGNILSGSPNDLAAFNSHVEVGSD